MLINILLIIVGLVVLIAGAEGLVRGASSLAAKLRVSPLIIGLTIVAFGTSAPELTVNMAAALNGSADIALGNIVGSNIANILLILGVSALIVPLTVKSSTVWKEIPLAFLGVFLLFVMGNDFLFDGVPFTAITRTDGIVLMTLMVIFMYYIVGMAKTERAASSTQIADDEGEEIKQYKTIVALGLVLGGLGGLVLGGRLLVTSAVTIAESAGLSQSLIGLTIVGIGTSLPELATSLVAALRKQADIAIGNIIGSNIFNIFWVIGLTGTILQLPFDSAINTDVMVSVAVTALLFAYMFIGKKRQLDRWQGATFVVAFIGYMAFIIQRG